MNDIELAKMLFGDSNTTVSSESSLVPGRTRTYTAVALADSENGYVLVQVNGDMVTGNGQSSMRLPTQAIVKVGDVVNITVVNGSPVVTGAAGWGDMVGNTIVAQNAQIQNLQASKASIDALDAQVARIDDLTADFADIETLVASKADISVLEADYAHITNGVIDNATIDAADVNDLSANYAHISNGVIDNATIDAADVNDLSANYAHISNGVIDNATIGVASVNDLSANYAHISNGAIDNANISYANVNGLSANYAQLNMANVNNSWIENGTIRDGAISNAMIASVSANKLTAGTIDASSITVTNLNADNITTGTINGQRIGTGSLSLDKLSEDVYTESEIDGIVSGLQDQIDGAIETWTGDAVPTLNNSPASSWTTNATRDTHVGDVYFVVNSQSQQNGYNYRFTKSGNTYSWQLIKDNDVTQALQRLTNAEGKISTIESFDSDISSWRTDTDAELSSVKSRTASLETRVTSAEGDISTKVDTTTFNTLSQTVDGNTSSITTLSTITTNNGLTSSTNITNAVNTVSSTATSNSTKISQLTTTLGTNADGTTKAGDIVHRTTDIEADLSGFKSTVSSTYATTTALGGVEATANNANGKLVAYSGTCSTAASTAAKVVACQNFALSAGTAITIRFSTANTSTGALTLNVNSTGAKTIYVNGSTTNSSNQLLWAANANITFTYDGTYWRVDSEPRTWYGSCSIAAGTAAKTASINEAVICKGTQVVLNMTYENTSTSATLNVTSVGAKNIYYGTTTTRPTTSNGYGWTANSTATFVFDGAYWRIGDTSAMAKITATNSVVSQHTTKIDQNAEAIALKADSSTTYTKTDVDGLISTEVTNRNAAITAASDNISLSISETYNKVSSRGEQLVTNGNGLMGDNTNYPSLTFDGSVANGSPGSFTHTPQYYGCFPEEKFPIDPSAEYIVSCDAISEDGTAKAYGCVLTYDVDGLSIDATHVGYVAGSLTTLARELKSGDTTVYLTDVSGFMAQTYYSHQRSLRFWDYTNSYGYMYPPETYTRNITGGDTWEADSSINRSTNTITLKTAYYGPTHAAGTYVSEGLSGSTYLYFFGPSTIPSTWTSYSRLLSGSVANGNPNTFAFRPGTAFCGIGFLWNYGMTSSEPQGRMWVTNISMMKSSPSAGEFATAAAQISVNADNIESKVSKNGVISSINQSPETVTINANRVNIAGAAIFTSGRLSESSLNSTYATPDDIPTNISDLENDSGFQTSSQVESAITSKGYQTASQVESAITGKGYATTAQANAEEQLIYKSATAGTSSMAKYTTWVTASGDTQNAWTTKRPTYSASYPVLFVATQRKSVSGVVSCTTPVKDDTTTVIDGGHITTGTIDASVATITNINANNITAGTLSVDRINANSITLNKISTDAQDAILNENVVVGGKNLLWLSSLIVVGGGPDDKDVNSGWVSDTTPTGDSRSWSYANSNWIVDLDAGDYVLSWDVLDNNSTDNTSQGIRLFKQDGTTIWSSGSSDYPFNAPGHKTHSFKMESAATVGIMFKLYDAVARFKLEAGTNGTDWTPAPEDVVSNISSVNTKLTETISGLEEAVTNSVSELVDDVSNANDRLDTLDVVVDGKLDAGYLKTWLDATPDELTLGRESATGTTVKAVLDAEKLSFKVGSEKVATYGGTAGMSVPKATVDTALTIGGFIWTTSDGHLTLKYVG